MEHSNDVFSLTIQSWIRSHVHLCHSGVKVVHNHNHHCSCLLGTTWVVLNGVSPVIKNNYSCSAAEGVDVPHVKVRSESVHVDVSILVQLGCKLWSKGRVQVGRKITKSVLQRLLFGRRGSKTGDV